MTRPVWRGYPDDPRLRLRVVRSQIEGKAKLKRDLIEERAFIIEKRQSVHHRPADEYIRPGLDLHMSTWEVADSISRFDQREFAERPLAWAGVRGATYADPALLHYAPGQWQRLWGELVPEPFNEHDPNAVAIDVDGVRIGYLSATYVRYAHTCICALNNRGFRVLVPVRYRTRYVRELKLFMVDAFVARPTFEEFDKLLPTQEECDALLQPLWDALEESVREQIARDRFRLTEETLAHLIDLRHMAPEVGLPAIPRLSAVSYEANKFVSKKLVPWRWKRDQRIVDAFEDGWRQVDISRMQGVSSNIVSRVLRDAGIDTSTPRVSPRQRQLRDQIVERLTQGSTRREAMEELGVSASEVSAAIKGAGISVPSRAGLNDYTRDSMRARLETCRRAVELADAGLTYAQIADTLEVGHSTIKTLLRDGRFFQDPTTNTDRLARAQALWGSGAKHGQLSTAADKQALRDGNVLDLIGKPWR